MLRAVLEAEPLIPLAVLMLAAVGAAASWLFTRPMALVESSLSRFLAFAGVPLIFAALLLCPLGLWAGIVRPADYPGFSPFGLIPNSDPSAYYDSVFDLMLIGEWNFMSSRRPLAQAIRDALGLASGYSYQWNIILQAALVAAGLYWASAEITRWRGLWPAVAFVGFTLILARQFLPSVMTEPLALALALASIALVIIALREQSVPHAMLSLALLTAALLVRMGAMFLIPFFVLWIALAFDGSLRQRIMRGALACAIVAAVFLFSLGLAKAYATTRAFSGSNFALSVCGLSLGSDWRSCYDRYASGLAAASDDAEAVLWFLRRAWENVAADPGVFFRALVRNASAYILGLPNYLVLGYPPVIRDLAIGPALLLLLSPALIFFAVRRAAAGELLLWLGVLATAILSAAVIFADAGWRSLHVGQAFLAAFAAMSLLPSATPTPQARRAPSIGPPVATFLCSLALLAGVPPLARSLMQAELAQREIAGPDAEHRVVLGKSLTGFIVQEDVHDTPLAFGVVPYSAFAHVTIAHGVLSPTIARSLKARLPFAFVWGKPLGGSVARFYIAPLELLQSPAWAWRVRVANVGDPNLPELDNVLSAAPIY